jgi:hypothetical protein
VGRAIRDDTGDWNGRLVQAQHTNCIFVPLETVQLPITELGQCSLACGLCDHNYSGYQTQ